KELRERARQARAAAAQHREAASGKFDGALEVEDAQLFAKLPVRLGGKRKARCGPGGSHDDVRRLVGAVGNRVVEQIRRAFEQRAQRRTVAVGRQVAHARFGLFDLYGKRVELRPQLARERRLVG